MATRQRGSNNQTASKQQPNLVTIASSAHSATRLAAPAREERIAICAYLRAAERGFVPGHELEDWLAAERELEANGEIGAPAARS